MDIIPQNKTKIYKLIENSFFLYFYMPNANGTEWIDYDLPIPTLLHHTERGVYIGWVLKGYFGTNKGIEYLNDIVARYLITFKTSQRLPYKPQQATITEKTHKSLGKHRLKSFQGLKSIVRAKKLVATRSDNFKDHVFWAIKFFCEDLIISQGIPTYQQLESFAFNSFDYKEKSTLKAKCRSVFNWYDVRDFKIPKRYKQTKEEYKVTRTENITKMNKQRAAQNSRRVENLLSGKYASDFKKKSGTWHIGKIAKELNIARDTVKKYLLQLSDNDARLSL